MTCLDLLGICLVIWRSNEGMVVVSGICAYKSGTKSPTVRDAMQPQACRQPARHRDTASGFIPGTKPETFVQIRV